MPTCQSDGGLFSVEVSSPRSGLARVELMKSNKKTISQPCWPRLDGFPSLPPATSPAQLEWTLPLSKQPKPRSWPPVSAILLQPRLVRMNGELALFKPMEYSGCWAEEQVCQHWRAPSQNGPMGRGSLGLRKAARTSGWDRCSILS